MGRTYRSRDEEGWMQKHICNAAMEGGTMLILVVDIRPERGGLCECTCRRSLGLRACDGYMKFQEEEAGIPTQSDRLFR